MVTRNKAEFNGDGGIKLLGALYVPEHGKGRYPAITMAHGYAGVKEHGLERVAQLFAENDFAVLLHDHRNFGASEGEPRVEIDPWQQVRDYRHAITWVRTQPGIDRDRIGVWGSSYSGGHALVLGAIDRRIKCGV